MAGGEGLRLGPLLAPTPWLAVVVRPVQTAGALQGTDADLALAGGVGRKSLPRLADLWGADVDLALESLALSADAGPAALVWSSDAGTVALPWSADAGTAALV